MNTQVWEFSAKRSLLQFKVKFLEISNITGSFLKFAGKVITDEAFNDPEVTLLIEASSIETFDRKRNAKLKAGAFFSAGIYPQLSFTSVAGCKKSSGKIWELTGELTIKGISRSITLLINFVEIRADKNPPSATIHLFGNIKRSEFGLDCADEKDVGDEVHLYAEIFMIRAQ